LILFESIHQNLSSGPNWPVIVPRECILPYWTSSFPFISSMQRSSAWTKRKWRTQNTSSKLALKHDFSAPLKLRPNSAIQICLLLLLLLVVVVVVCLPYLASDSFVKEVLCKLTFAVWLIYCTSMSLLLFLGFHKMLLTTTGLSTCTWANPRLPSSQRLSTSLSFWTTLPCCRCAGHRSSPVVYH